MSLALFETDCNVLNYSGDSELNLLSLFTKILINESTIGNVSSKQQRFNGSASDFGVLEGRVVIGRGSPNFPVDVKIVARPRGKDIISRRHAVILGKFQLLHRVRSTPDAAGGLSGGAGRSSSPPSSCSLQNAHSSASGYYLEPISYCIEDVGAVNGLFVNGYRIKAAELCNNDIVQLGGAANCKFFDKIGSSDVNVKFQFTLEGCYHKVSRSKQKITSTDSLAATTSSSSSKRPVGDVDENSALMNAAESPVEGGRIASESKRVKRYSLSISKDNDTSIGVDAAATTLSPSIIDDLRRKLVERDDFIKQKTVIIERNGKTIKELQTRLAEEERMKESFTSEMDTHLSTISTLKQQLQELNELQSSSGVIVLREQLSSCGSKLRLAEASLAERTRETAALEKSLSEYKALYTESMLKVKALTRRVSNAEADAIGSAMSISAAASSVDLQKGLLDYVKCGICLDIMIDASVMRNCSHGFCRCCLESLLRNSSFSSARCPVCNYRAGGAEDEARGPGGEFGGDGAFASMYSRSAQLDGLCALAVEASSVEQQEVYAARTRQNSLYLEGLGIRVDLPCNWRQQLLEFDAPSEEADSDLAMSENQFRAANGFLVLTEEEKAAIYSDGVSPVAGGTTASVLAAATAPPLAAPAAGPKCYYCGGDDHDHEECEHFEKIEEGDSDEDEEIDQSQDY